MGIYWMQDSRKINKGWEFVIKPLRTHVLKINKWISGVKELVVLIFFFFGNLEVIVEVDLQHKICQNCYMYSLCNCRMKPKF